MYDYLIVGAGLYGSTFAYEATKRGKIWKRQCANYLQELEVLELV